MATSLGHITRRAAPDDLPLIHFVYCKCIRRVQEFINDVHRSPEIQKRYGMLQFGRSLPLAECGEIRQDIQRSQACFSIWVFPSWQGIRAALKVKTVDTTLSSSVLTCSASNLFRAHVEQPIVSELMLAKWGEFSCKWARRCF